MAHAIPFAGEKGYEVGPLLEPVYHAPFYLPYFVLFPLRHANLAPLSPSPFTAISAPLTMDPLYASVGPSFPHDWKRERLVASHPTLVRP
jgi:hypothetical protein